MITEKYNLKPTETVIADDEGMGIDLMEVLQFFVSLRYKCLCTALIAAVVGLVFSFAIPRQYRVSVTIVPETKIGTAKGSMAGMTALFGKKGSATRTDALDMSLSSQIVSSTPFMCDLLAMHVIDEQAGIDTTLSAYMDGEKLAFWKYPLKLPEKLLGGIYALWSPKEEGEVVAGNENAGRRGVFNLSKKELAQIVSLRSKISTDVSYITGIITVSVELQNPSITAMVADKVVLKLKDYLQNYNVAKAKEDLAYWMSLYNEHRQKYYRSQQLYAQYMDSNSNVVWESSLMEKKRLQDELTLNYHTYTQTTLQLQMAQAKLQEVKHAFTVIEPAVVPTVASSMGKLTTMLVFVVVALLGLLGWEFLLKDLIQDYRAFKSI